MSGKILVTGATGNVGSSVVEALIARGQPVVAAAQDVTRAQEQLGLPCQYVAFDFLKPETHRPALEGVGRIFLMRPPEMSHLHTVLDPLFAAATEAGVRQVVYLSVLGADKIPRNPHKSVEKYLRGAGLPWTFLRPSFFMQNLHQHHSRLIRERGELSVPAGRGRTSFVDTRDLGEAVARVLTEPGHEDQAYTLTGAEALTYSEVATVFTEVLGRPIRYTNPSPWSFRREMLAQGYPKDFANLMLVIYSTARVGLAAAVTPELEQLLGRPPKTVADYVRDFAGYFCAL